MQQLLDKTFRDDKGKLVIFQFPNFLLWCWIIIKLVNYFLNSGTLNDGLELLGSTVLFAWAYLEAAEGVNYFRKGLGIVIITFIVIGYFQIN